MISKARLASSSARAPAPMQDSIRRTFQSLRSSAEFFAVRYTNETRETLAVRQDTIEPPRLSFDRGAMVTAISRGGYGYCSTSDLSLAGLQKALDRAAAWAEASSKASVHA